MNSQILSIEGKSFNIQEVFASHYVPTDEAERLYGGPSPEGVPTPPYLILWLQNGSVISINSVPEIDKVVDAMRRNSR